MSDTQANGEPWPEGCVFYDRSNRHKFEYTGDFWFDWGTCPNDEWPFFEPGTLRFT